MISWQYVIEMQRPQLGKTVICRANNRETNVSLGTVVHDKLGTNSPKSLRLLGWLDERRLKSACDLVTIKVTES